MCSMGRDYPIQTKHEFWDNLHNIKQPKKGEKNEKTKNDKYKNGRNPVQFIDQPSQK